MSDYYQELGVSRDASAEEIRSAYRRKAKAAHPDREGGSTSEITKVNVAKEVLLDPIKRLTYDRMGKLPEHPVDQRGLARLVNEIAQWLNADDVSDYDNMLTNIETKLTNQLITMKQAASQGDQRALRARKRLAKLKAKGKPTLVLAMLTDQLRLSDQARECAKEQILTLEAAIAMLKDYEYEPEPLAPEPSVMSKYLASKQSWRLIP